MTKTTAANQTFNKTFDSVVFTSDVQKSIESNNGYEIKVHDNLPEQSPEPHFTKTPFNGAKYSKVMHSSLQGLPDTVEPSISVYSQEQRRPNWASNITRGNLIFNKPASTSKLPLTQHSR